MLLAVGLGYREYYPINIAFVIGAQINFKHVTVWDSVGFIKSYVVGVEVILLPIVINVVRRMAGILNMGCNFCSNYRKNILYQRRRRVLRKGVKLYENTLGGAQLLDHP